MYIATRDRKARKYQLCRFDFNGFNAATTILEKAIKRLIAGTVADSSKSLEERASVVIGLLRPQAFVSALNFDGIRMAVAIIETIKDEAEKNYLRYSLLSACQDLIIEDQAEIFEDEDEEQEVQNSSNDAASSSDVEDAASPDDIFEEALSRIFNSIPRKWQDGTHIESRAKYLTQRLCYANIKEDLEKLDAEFAHEIGVDEYDLTLSREEIRDLIEEIEDARAHDRALSDYYFVDAFVRQRMGWKAYWIQSKDRPSYEVEPEKDYEISTDVDAEPDTIEGVFYRYDGVFSFIKEDDWTWVVDYDEYESVRYDIEPYFAELFKKAVGELVRKLRNGELDEDDAEELKNILSDYVPNLLTREEYVDLLYDGDAQDYETRLRAVALEFNAFDFFDDAANVRRFSIIDDQRTITDAKYQSYLSALNITQTLAAKTNDLPKKAERLLRICKIQFMLGDDPEFKNAKATVREILALIPQLPALCDRLNLYRDLVRLHWYPKVYFGAPKEDGNRPQICENVFEGKMKRAAEKLAKLFVKEALKPDASGIERDFYLASLENVDFLCDLKHILGADDLVEELLNACETEYVARRIRLLLNLTLDKTRNNYDNLDELVQETLQLVDLTDPLGAVALTNDIYDVLVED